MNKFYCLIITLFILTTPLYAQIGFRFDNGINVAMMSRTIPETSKSEMQNKYKEIIGYHPKNLSSIYRSFFNHQDKISFNYGIEITPNSDNKTYQVTIKPTKNLETNDGVDDTKNYKAMTLPNYPTNITVNDGDTIVLDILENPTTKAKIQDLIKITRDYKPFDDYFSENEEPTDFTIDDVQLQLADYKIYLNGKLIERTMNRSSRSRFFGLEFNKYDSALVLTAVPVKGYDFKKVGVIDENKLSFVYNGDKFEIVSTVPILGLGKKWNLWMLDPPRVYKDFKIPDNIGYLSRAVNEIKEFFPSQTNDKNTVDILRKSN